MASIKISADTSPVKKSLLDLGKAVKDLSKSKVSVFSEQDRKFIKNELNRELTTMKTKLKENQSEISKLVQLQKTLTKDSKEELRSRETITKSYKEQARLAKDIEALETQRRGAGFGGGMGGRGGIMGLLGRGLGLAAAGIGAGALSAVAYGGVRTMQAGSQFQAGSRNRVRLRGLGVEGNDFGTPRELARAGLSEQDIIERQINATARLGRQGASRQSILQQAQFERSFGLEGGQMTNASTSLRAQFGGKGADVAQQKLQAAILASGIEDAIGPYLESATDLLASINENGVTNTEEITKMFSQLVKDGQRTPEQLSAAFKGLDQAVRGSKGEANAFMQTAFARAGIGGGKIGATRLAIESGGIFGLNAGELGQRGYNPALIQNLQNAGFTQGVGGRTGAILNQFKKSAGVNGRIADITDVDTMTQLSHMANGVFGTQGNQGFDALMMLEQVQNKQMSQGDFTKKMDELKTKQDPTLDRLNKINETLAGQTTILDDIRTNSMEALGKRGGAQLRNTLTEADIQGIKATTNTVGAVNDTGLIDATRRGIQGGGDYLLGGHLADLPEQISNGLSRLMDRIKPAPIDPKYLGSLKNNINIKVQNSDGKVLNKTHR